MTGREEPPLSLFNYAQDTLLSNGAKAIDRVSVAEQIAPAISSVLTP
jgi:hypothetical protein